MNDGGGECGKGSENKHRNKKNSRIDDFSKAIARVSAAQICEGAGFQGVQQSALDTLSDVGVRYIREIGKTAKLYANLAGRSQCNVFDVIEGLENMGSLQGVPGASDVNNCFSSSVIIRDIITRYMLEAEEIPFAYAVPAFPIIREHKSDYSFAQKSEVPPGEHIPVWLPQFPEPDTYGAFKNEEKTETRVYKIKPVEERKNVGRPFFSLPQQLTCNGCEATLSVDAGIATKVTGDHNPFLAAPLQFSEKDVSPVALPTKLADQAMGQLHDHAAMGNYISALETFTPVIEAVNRKACNFEDERKRISLNRKSIVCFKFRSNHKSLCTEIISQKGKVDSWFSSDHGTDDKRRRADQILKQSMDNQHELYQL